MEAHTLVHRPGIASPDLLGLAAELEACTAHVVGVVMRFAVGQLAERDLLDAEAGLRATFERFLRALELERGRGVTGPSSPFSEEPKPGPLQEEEQP